MTAALLALLGYAAWAILLALAVVSWRSAQVLAGRAAANAFPADTPHGPDGYRRLNRAHLNVLENLPIFGTIVIVGHLAGVSSDTFDALALGVLAARLAQTLVHVSSGSARAVHVRFGFFLAQLAALIAMAVQILAVGDVP